MNRIELSKQGFKAVIQIEGQSWYYFRFDVEETENETVVCSEVCITLQNANYEKMVSALIGVKYSTDAQLALLYNYQADAESYAEQMSEYQAWRTYCKESARAFFGIEEDTPIIENNYTEEESGE